MSIVVAALSLSDILISLLLASLGVVVFALVRPTEQDPEMDLWSDFIKQFRRVSGAGSSGKGRRDRALSQDPAGPKGSRNIGISYLQKR